MSLWKFAVSSADTAPRTAPILLQGSIPENLACAAALGYDAIEVHTREDAPLDYDAIRRAEDMTGTKVCMIITGRLNTEGQCNLLDDRPYVVQAAMDGMRQYIQTAQKINADLVIGWMRGQIPSHRDATPYWDRLAKNLRTLAETAAESNVKLNLEVINRYEINTFNTAAETAGFIERYNLKNCYVHLDTFHMMIDECDPVAAIHRCAGKLGYVHLADNSRRYPGSGQIDFVKLLQALRDTNYQGYLAVECLPDPDGESAARSAIQHLKALTASLPDQ